MRGLASPPHPDTQRPPHTPPSSFSSTCRTTYDFFSLLTSACVLFLLGITYKKMKPLYDYVLKIIRSILSELTVDAKKKKN